jgi:hypothetical protein
VRMVLVKNSLVKKKCETALSWWNSQLFWYQSLGRSRHTFSVKVTVVCGIDCLACQDEFFVSNPLDVKENDEHALDFDPHLSYLFQSRWVLTFPLGGLLLSLRVLIVSPPLANSDNPGQEGCTLAVPLLDPSQNCVRSDTRLEIKRCRKSARPPSCIKFYALTPKKC